MEQRSISQIIAVPTITIESQPKEVHETPSNNPSNNPELSPTCKNILYPAWLVWVTVSTAICCPVLACAFMGNCERSSGGYPTYPICIAELQCCSTMCCKCERGY